MDNRQTSDSHERSFARRNPARSDNTKLHDRPLEPQHPVAELQRLIGNQQVMRLLVQRAPEDEEEENESVQLQRAPEDEEEEDESVQLQRAPDDQMEQEETLQTKADPGAEGGALSAPSATRIQDMRGGGSPLGGTLRGDMESSFNTDFSDVRVHTGGDAAALNHSLSSKAFTTGADIFLRADASASDPSLMAHELTHVVQQRSMASEGSGMQVRAAGDHYEQQADAVAKDVLSGSKEMDNQ